MFNGKPIIGIVGGIGSGKSFVARLLAECKCMIIDSDDLVSQAYRQPEILNKLRLWWDNAMFLANGQINRKAIGKLVFSDPGQRKRLEGLLHPWVDQQRKKLMKAAEGDAQVLAFVWDTPLLIETGLIDQCDAVVFVESSAELRTRRIAAARGWDRGELQRREKLQTPLDKKKQIAHYVINNTANAENVRSQIRVMLPKILAAHTNKTR